MRRLWWFILLLALLASPISTEASNQSGHLPLQALANAGASLPDQSGLLREPADLDLDSFQPEDTDELTVLTTHVEDDSDGVVVILRNDLSITVDTLQVSVGYDRDGRKIGVGTTKESLPPTIPPDGLAIVYIPIEGDLPRDLSDVEESITVDKASATKPRNPPYRTLEITDTAVAADAASIEVSGPRSGTATSAAAILVCFEGDDQDLYIAGWFGDRFEDLGLRRGDSTELDLPAPGGACQRHIIGVAGSE